MTNTEIRPTDEQQAAIAQANPYVKSIPANEHPVNPITPARMLVRDRDPRKRNASVSRPRRVPAAMRRLLAAALGALVLLVPAAASASPLANALLAGSRYWGAVPCDGNISVVTSQQPPSKTSSSTPQQEEAVEKGFLEVTAWAPMGGCTIYLGRWWSQRQHQEWWPQWFCDIVTHELGHLAPFDHGDVESTNPANITYSQIEPGTPNFNAVPECRIASWPQAQRT